MTVSRESFPENGAAIAQGELPHILAPVDENVEYVIMNLGCRRPEILQQPEIGARPCSSIATISPSKTVASGSFLAPPRYTEIFCRERSRAANRASRVPYS